MIGLRHLLNLSDLGPGGLRLVLDAAQARKKARRGLPQGMADADAPLDGAILASLFEKPSTRTRLSFDVAMRQLGGSAITLAAHDMQLGRGETIEDTARVLSGFVDAIMIRANRHADVELLAQSAGVPVLNGLTDLSHPCQIVADLLTIEEDFGRPVDGSCWAWVGDGNNVCNSLIEAAGLLGLELRVAHPAGYAPNPHFVDQARAAGAHIELLSDPAQAVRNADVVVTDTWVSMGDTDADARHRAFAGYQVSYELMRQAALHARFLHCLPAHRGEEVAADVIDGPRSLVWAEAANRVHAQKALLLWAFDRIS